MTEFVQCMQIMSPERIIIDLTDKSILDNGVIEYLVLSGRIPCVRELPVPSRDGYRLEARCIVPPPGTMPDDTMFEPSVGACEYISPDGKSRGWGTQYNIPPEKTQELKKRIKMATKGINTPGENFLHKLSRKLG